MCHVRAKHRKISSRWMDHTLGHPPDVVSSAALMRLRKLSSRQPRPRHLPPTSTPKAFLCTAGALAVLLSFTTAHQHRDAPAPAPECFSYARVSNPTDLKKRFRGEQRSPQAKDRSLPVRVRARVLLTRHAKCNWLTREADQMPTAAAFERIGNHVYI